MSHFNVIVPVSKDLFGPEENKFIDTQDICTMQNEEKKKNLPDEYFKVMRIINNEVERLMAPYYEGLDGNDNVEDKDVTDECLDWYFEKGADFVHKTPFLRFLVSYYGATIFHRGELDPFESDGIEVRALIDDKDVPDEPFTVEEIIEAPMGDAISEEDFRELVKSAVQVWRMEPAEPKWDWYEVGGRWENDLIYTGKTKNEEGGITWARVRDVAWKYNLDDGEMNYLKHTWNVLIGKEENKDRFPVIFKPEYYIERYKNFDGYLKECQFNYPYAAINLDGYWFERGNVGYGGGDDATKESIDTFCKQFKDMIDGLDPNDIIVIVDCHI